jgi:urease accessory protein
MRTPIMAENGAILRLLTWFSPGFPTGAYAYSHGLEWAVGAGDVADAATLHAWIDDLLRHGAGRSDTILLRHAHRAVAVHGRSSPAKAGVHSAATFAEPWTPASAGEERGEAGTPDFRQHELALANLAELAEAAAPCRERRVETMALGAAFAAAALPWAELDAAPYPVAVGALTARCGIDEDDAAIAYLQAFAANLISAGVRLIPLGQSAGLAVLAGLEPIILATVRETREAGLHDIGGACFRSDIAAMRHETQYTRLFRT